MTKMKVMVLVGAGHNAVCSMFVSEGWELCHDINDTDLVVFTGGEDVTPTLYNQRIHPRTNSNVERDNTEKEVYLNCLDLGIPMAGICRGGQFLNVMNGGEMYQHVDGHAIGGTHKAWILGGVLSVEVTSTHHQMMKPNYSDEVIILMTAKEATRKEEMSLLSDINAFERLTYADKTGRRTTDIESLYYPNTRCLCYQPHPEFVTPKAKETREVFFNFLESYLFPHSVNKDEDEGLIDEA